MKTILEYLQSGHITASNTTFTESPSNYKDFNDIENCLHLYANQKPYTKYVSIVFYVKNSPERILDAQISYKDLQNMDIHKLVAYCKYKYKNSQKKPGSNIYFSFYSKESDDYEILYFIDMNENPERLQCNIGQLDDKDSKQLQNIFSEYVE